MRTSREDNGDGPTVDRVPAGTCHPVGSAWTLAQRCRCHVAGVFAAEQGVKEGLKGDGDGACPGCCGQRSIWEEKRRRRCKIKQLSAWPRVSAGGHGCGAVAHHSIHRVAT